MKQTFTLLITLSLLVCSRANAQLVMNELYTDPGSGNAEFFELYNTSSSSFTYSTDNITMVTFFDISGQKGFYVMDLPNMTVSPRGYFVGAAALPFNYQGNTGSMNADFNWNSSSFTSNNGYIKKWVKGTANLADGNLSYDEAALPANFNDFFYRRTGSGASYTVFLFNNGQLINAFAGGTGGNTTIINDIVNMPALHVDMTAASPDFNINFTGYGSIPVEYCTQDAGSDNGYIRQFDGACASWVKSSAGVQHTPKASNGKLIGVGTGSVSVSAAISQGTPAAGSVIHNDVVTAPASFFPITLQLYTDLGTKAGSLDPTDVNFDNNTETVVTQGPFHNTFTPYDANILIAVKTNAGCFDKILLIPNTIILSVKLISFTGIQNEDNIQLYWNVEANESADHFEVQRSENGADFYTVGLVFATENSGRANYSFKVPAVHSGKVAYRLRMFSKDGTVGYSAIHLFLKGQVMKKKTLFIISNPVTDKLTFRYDAASNLPLNITVVDVTGSPVLKAQKNGTKGPNEICMPLSVNIKSGAYIIDLFDGTDHYTAKFIKQ